MPDLFKVMAERRSVRNYSEEEVNERDLNVILEAACSAPSAGNLQAYEVVVVRERERRIALARASYNQIFMAQAPVHLVFLAYPARSASIYGGRGAELYSIQDATIAAAFAMLAAHALGYGTCWVGAFRDDEVLSIIGAPEDRVPVAILTVGRPKGGEYTTSRLALGEVVFNEMHGRPFPLSPARRELLRPGC